MHIQYWISLYNTKCTCMLAHFRTSCYVMFDACLGWKNTDYSREFLSFSRQAPSRCADHFPFHRWIAADHFRGLVQLQVPPLNESADLILALISCLHPACARDAAADCTCLLLSINIPHTPLFAEPVEQQAGWF